MVATEYENDLSDKEFCRHLVRNRCGYLTATIHREARELMELRGVSQVYVVTCEDAGYRLFTLDSLHYAQRFYYRFIAWVIERDGLPRRPDDAERRQISEATGALYRCNC